MTPSNYTTPHQESSTLFTSIQESIRETREEIRAREFQEFEERYKPEPKTYKITPFTFKKTLNREHKFRAMQVHYLNTLVSFMSETVFSCKVSQRIIAMAMGVSVRTVATIQSEFEKAGIIRTKFNYKQNGHRGVSTVILQGALDARDYVDRQQQARLKAEARQRLESEYKDLLIDAPQHSILLNEATSSLLLNTGTIDISWKIDKEVSASMEGDSYYQKPFIVDWRSYKDWIQAIKDKVSGLARRISNTCLPKGKKPDYLPGKLVIISA